VSLCVVEGGSRGTVSERLCRREFEINLLCKEVERKRERERERERESQRESQRERGKWKMKRPEVFAVPQRPHCSDPHRSLLDHSMTA